MAVQFVREAAFMSILQKAEASAHAHTCKQMGWFLAAIHHIHPGWALNPHAAGDAMAIIEHADAGVAANDRRTQAGAYHTHTTSSWRYLARKRLT